ncbi:flagellar export protein FliJ [candidate division KSB1 bacterium]|nr:flagellar export protein FliJ [candidate division KSB1 bacterium]
MKRFQFRLERVLQLKQQMELQKQQELGVVTARMQIAEHTLAEMETRRSEYHQQRNDLVKTGSSQRDIFMMNQHQQHLKQLVKKQKQVIARIQKEVMAKQAALQDAVREKEKYEQYHAHKWDEYQRSVLAEEQQFLDEVALRKHHFDPQIQGK